MTTRTGRTAIVLAIAVLALAAPAGAARGEAVIRDCTSDGKIDRRYSPADYQEALRDLPTDVDEYTDCREVIRRAQAASRRRGSEGGDAARRVQAYGQGYVPTEDAQPTPSERRRAREAAERGGIVKLDGEAIEPGKRGRLEGATASSTNDLPGPLLAALIAFGAAVLLTVIARIVARRRRA